MKTKVDKKERNSAQGPRTTYVHVSYTCGRSELSGSESDWSVFSSLLSQTI